MMKDSKLLLFVVLCVVIAVKGFQQSVLFPRPISRGFANSPPRLWATEEKLPDIDSMKASEMRKELESYGIPTKSLFEKSEFVEALKKARVEGKKPKKERKTASTKQSSSAAPSDTTTREERYQKAFEQAQSMGVKDLKQELKNRGISTASFFEKSEFIKAYAEAVADKKGKDKKVEEEPQDPSYRDVVMQKFDRRQLAGQSVIEIRLPR